MTLKTFPGTKNPILAKFFCLSSQRARRWTLKNTGRDTKENMKMVFSEDFIKVCWSLGIVIKAYKRVTSKFNRQNSQKFQKPSHKKDFLFT